MGEKKKKNGSQFNKMMLIKRDLMLWKYHYSSISSFFLLLPLSFFYHHYPPMANSQSLDETNIISTDIFILIVYWEWRKKNYLPVIERWRDKIWRKFSRIVTWNDWWIMIYVIEKIYKSLTPFNKISSFSSKKKIRKKIIAQDFIDRERACKGCLYKSD